MSDYYKMAYQIGVLIVVAYAVIMIINALSEQKDTLVRSGENMVEASLAFSEQLTKYCEVKESVLEELNERLATSLKDEKARELAQKLLDGDELSQCEWHEFLNHLNEWEKRKLRVYDLACNLSICINTIRD